LIWSSYQTSQDVAIKLKYPVEGNCMQPRGVKGDRAGTNAERKRTDGLQSQDAALKQKTIRYIMIA
jgi:hypothetical protein